MVAELAKMTFSEWIDLATAVILLITLIAILWYTSETYKLRKVASKQLAIQQGHIKPYLQLKVERVHNDGKSDYKVETKVKNCGGPAYYTNIKPNGDFSVEIEDTGGYIGAGEEITLIIKGNNLGALGELTFNLECLDAIGRKHTLQGVYQKGKNGIFREKS